MIYFDGQTVGEMVAALRVAMTLVEMGSKKNDALVARFVEVTDGLVRKADAYADVMAGAKQVVMGAGAAERNEQLLEFYESMVAWGASDVRTALRWIVEAGLDIEGFGAWLPMHAEMGSLTLGETDVCAAALEYICLESGVEDLIGYIWSNCLDSQFDVDGREAGRLLVKVDVEERFGAWLWLVEFTTADLLETECEYCGQVVNTETECASTHCGLIHIDCLESHYEMCDVCAQSKRMEEGNGGE